MRMPTPSLHRIVIQPTCSLCPDKYTHLQDFGREQLRRLGKLDPKVCNPMSPSSSRLPTRMGGLWQPADDHERLGEALLRVLPEPLRGAVGLRVRLRAEDRRTAWRRPGPGDG